MSTTQQPVRIPPPPEPPAPPPRRRWWRPWFWAALVAPLTVALALVAFDAMDTVEVSTPTTTTATTAPDGTTVPSLPDTATAVWPPAGRAGFGDPVEAARSFAVDLAGFTAPVVGSFQAGDARSGEVEVRPRPEGPVTTVFVRRLGAGDTWWVLGSASGSFQLDTPTAGSVVWSPLHLGGRSTAFEATVAVEVRADGVDQPLVRDVVMGGANGEMRPFEKTFVFDPVEGFGTVVLFTESMEDGGTMEASVVRVRFGPPAPPTTTVELTPGGVAGVAFGTPADEAVTRLTALFGPPRDDRSETGTMPDGIGGDATTVRHVRYGALVVTFTDWPVLRDDGELHLARWIALGSRGPAGEGLATAEGIAVGSTMAEVRAAYGAAVTAGFEECVNGFRFSVGPPAELGLIGALDRSPEDSDAVVTLLTAGLQSSC